MYRDLRSPVDINDDDENFDLETQRCRPSTMVHSRSAPSPLFGVAGEQLDEGGDPIEIVESELRAHFAARGASQRDARHPDPTIVGRRGSRLHRTHRVASGGDSTVRPIGFDVFLSCSSNSELDWVTQKAVPLLQ